MADRLGCNIVAPIWFLEETEESHDAGAPSLRMQCSCLYLIFKHRKEAAHNAIGRSLSMLPFTRSLSVTFVELSEGNGVGGNGKGKKREGKGRGRRAKELVRSSRAFQGPFASVPPLSRSFPSGGIQSERQIQGGLLSKARTSASEGGREGEERECPGEIPRVDLSSTLSSSVPLSAPSSIVAECQGRSSAVGRSVGLSFAKWGPLEGRRRSARTRSRKAGRERAEADRQASFRAI